MCHTSLQAPQFVAALATTVARSVPVRLAPGVLDRATCVPHDVTVGLGKRDRGLDGLPRAITGDLQPRAANAFRPNK